jgi:hypothetical protein
MRIQTFRNMKGLIHGPNPKRIGCDKGGVLKIGRTEIPIVAGQEEIMPLLFNGLDGDFSATFTDKEGNVFELEKVEVRGGRINPPPPERVEFMELRCRIDEAEAACEAAQRRVHELSQIFDTNSLNFLIK